MTSKTEPQDSSIFPRTLGPRYLLLKAIGEGGMGQVYMALGGERLCALKLLHSGETSLEISKRLTDEGQLATKLSHQNVVYALDAGVLEGAPFVALEYLRGKTLYEVSTRLRKSGVRISIGLTFYIIREILRGLDYLHRAEGLSLVHRDLSPTNVMLTYEGAVKIIDLGLAKWIDKTAATMFGENWGQARYKSPEQCAGLTVDTRSDIFGVGVILWEMLTRRRLFEKDKPRQADALLPAPSTVIAGLSGEVDAIVMTALARDPKNRFQDARAFMKELTAYIEPDDDAAALRAVMEKIFHEEITAERAEETSLVAGAKLVVSQGKTSRPITPMILGLVGLLMVGGGIAWNKSRQVHQPPSVQTPAMPPLLTPPRVEAESVPEPPTQPKEPKASPGIHPVQGKPKHAIAAKAKTSIEPVPLEIAEPPKPDLTLILDKGRAALAERRIADAIQAGLEAIKLGSGGPGHALLGAAYQGAGELNQAEQHLKLAVQLDPSDAASSRRLEVVRRKLNQP